VAVACLLALGLLALACYRLVPLNMEVTYNLYYAAFGLSATMLIALGIRLNRPPYPWPWYLLFVGMLLLFVGDQMYGFYEIFLHEEAPFPSWVDAAYLVGSAVNIASVVLLVCAQQARGEGCSHRRDHRRHWGGGGLVGLPYGAALGRPHADACGSPRLDLLPVGGRVDFGRFCPAAVVLENLGEEPRTDSG
jgi:hypothetical protein